MNLNGRRILIIGFFALLFSFTGFAAVNYLKEYPWRNSIDYSKRSNGATFELATGKPKPTGVTNIRVAGRSYPQRWKHWIWMRFNITDQAIEQLTADTGKYTGSDAQKYIAISKKIPASGRYNGVDMRRVGWNEIEDIARPEVYDITPPLRDSAFVLRSYLILDRENRTAYVFAFGD